jgi:Fur family transcriptional regulator, ferric uptake regulator
MRYPNILYILLLITRFEQGGESDISTDAALFCSPLQERARRGRVGSAMKRRQSIPSLSDIRAIIRATGLRSTAPRVTVLQRLLQTTTPASHADLFTELADQGFDRATIYRNLIDLTEAGLLSRTDVGDHVWRFELRREGQRGLQSEHPHFMCTDCGEVSCLRGVNVRISSAPGVPRALSAKNVEVQLKGLCDRCAA